MTTIYISKDKADLPERHANDLYVTERSLIHVAMLHYAPVSTRSVLDIGAGDGRWGQIAADYTSPEHVVGIELEDKPRPDGFTQWYSPQDFLTFDWVEKYDFIVSNPPYFIAEEIIRRAWEILAPGGTMIFLLRLAFMAGISRYKGLWSQIYPWRVGVLSRRPSFYGGGTNGTDYGLFVWRKTTTLDGPYGRPQGWQVDLLYHERDSEIIEQKRSKRKR